MCTQLFIAPRTMRMRAAALVVRPRDSAPDALPLFGLEVVALVGLEVVGALGAVIVVTDT